MLGFEPKYFSEFLIYDIISTYHSDDDGTAAVVVRIPDRGIFDPGKLAGDWNADTDQDGWDANFGGDIDDYLEEPFDRNHLKLF